MINKDKQQGLCPCFMPKMPKGLHCISLLYGDMMITEHKEGCMNKNISLSEFIKSKNDKFLRFADLFCQQISNEELICALAQKDLEKLAKVFNLVFERIEKTEKITENNKLDELIKAISSEGDE